MIFRPLGFCALLVACDGTCGHAPPPPAAPAEASAARTPAQIRAEGNHLASSKSAYLQMHAHNPVDWYPWGDEAFLRAKAENKPVFLSIGYASCHWCHVMEADVFSKDDVAELLNQRFVAIKVDREERPDVDAIYVEAVTAMTGSAGWPLTVFLTPDLKPFYGATYVPHDAFLAAAKKSADELAASRADVETRAAELYARVAAAPEANAAGARVRGTEVVEAARRAVDRVDATNGGFRGRQKFPNPVRWRMMLHAWRKSGDASVEAVLRKTLDAIARGGMRDHVGGGFHRYTVDPTWTVPHFEKMLYVNAELADLFLEAGAALDPAYTEVALDTLDFLLRDMRLPDGTFAASLDADDPAGEGRFYTWTPKEIAEATGDPAIAGQIGVTDAGNFDGRTVLAPKRGPAWERARPKLLAARAKRPAPRRDDKAITSWNGLSVSALARAAVRTNDARWRSAAVTAGERLFAAHVTPDGVARALNAGTPSMPGTLDDYAALARAALDLFEATGDRAWVERAVKLVDEAGAKLAAPGGGFKNVADARTGKVDLFDSEEPNGNAVLAEAVLRLAALTARAPLYDLADKTLAAFAEEARGTGLGMASWLDASLLADGPFYDVVIVGAPPLADAWRAALTPWAIHAEIGAPIEDALLPALAGKTGPAAYVCVRGACKMPSHDVASFRAQLMAGWAR